MAFLRGSTEYLSWAEQNTLEQWSWCINYAKIL
jgi:hypothetical protein